MDTPDAVQRVGGRLLVRCPLCSWCADALDTLPPPGSANKEDAQRLSWKRKRQDDRSVRKAGGWIGETAVAGADRREETKPTAGSAWLCLTSLPRFPAVFTPQPRAVQRAAVARQRPPRATKERRSFLLHRPQTSRPVQQQQRRRRRRRRRHRRLCRTIWSVLPRATSLSSCGTCTLVTVVNRAAPAPAPLFCDAPTRRPLVSRRRMSKCFRRPKSPSVIGSSPTSCCPSVRRQHTSFHGLGSPASITHPPHGPGLTHL